MSLDFDYSKVKNHKTVCRRPCTDCKPDKPCYEHKDVPPEDRTMRNLVTESLIWYLGLSVGIPSITEKNWEEVAWRVALIEKVSGTTMYKYVKGQGKVDIPVTKEDVQRHIGLSTNGERMTKAQFFKRLTTRLDIPTDEDVAIIEKKVDEDRAKVA